MRADRNAVLVAAAIAMSIGGLGVSAHRLDEYLQTTRISVEPGQSTWRIGKP